MGVVVSYGNVSATPCFIIHLMLLILAQDHSAVLGLSPNTGLSSVLRLPTMRQQTCAQIRLFARLRTKIRRHSIQCIDVFAKDLPQFGKMFGRG